MAKQGGIIFLKGTIGGINFYDRLGVPTAREAGGGFTREAIKNGENMVRVREINSEFGICSRVNKCFKQAIRPVLIGYKDGTLHSRLMTLFLDIKDCDSFSIRGQRHVALGMASSKGKDLLKAFSFTPKRSALFPCKYEFNWANYEFSVSGFKAREVGFPKDSHYMEVLVGLVRFDFETRQYEQVFEAPLVIDRDFSGDTFSISMSGIPGGSGALIAVARVSFYQTVNGESYLLAGGGAFGIEVVGVAD